MVKSWLSPVILVCVLAIPVNSSNAQSPRDLLNQLAAQLQGNPGDAALRERIIKLAQEIKPPPSIPEEAERRLGRGRAAFETAKDAADFEKAMTEFSAAANAAPWLAAPYYNLGLAQEKAKRYREAMASLRLYLLASPGSPDTGEVRQKIFSLEYLAEQPPPPPPKPTDEQLLAGLNGARFVLSNVSVPVDSIGDNIYEIRGKEIAWFTYTRVLGPDDRRYNPHMLGQFVARSRMEHLRYMGALLWEGPREMSCPREVDSASCFAGTFQISQDGRSLTAKWWDWSARVERSVVYQRAN